MTDHTDYDGLAKNAQLVWRDLKEIWKGLREEKAENRGWTHAYMQGWRTACRRGPIAIATLCGIGGPILLVGAGIGWAL